MKIDPLERAIGESTRLAETTKKVYLTGVRSWLAYTGGDRRRFTPEEVDLWRRTLKKSMRNGWLFALRFAVKRLRLEDQAHGREPMPDFTVAAEPEKVKTKPRQSLTVPEAKALVGACRGPRPADLRDHALIVCGLRTGLRVAELCQFSFERYRSGVMHELRIKGGAEHEAPLDAEAKEALSAWITWLTTHGVKAGPIFRSIARPRIDGSVNLGKRQLSMSAAYQILVARAESAGIRHVHPHLLRHTFISWAVELAKLSKAQVQSATGQRDSAMIDHYTSNPREERPPVGSFLPSLKGR